MEILQLERGEIAADGRTDGRLQYFMKQGYKLDILTNSVKIEAYKQSLNITLLYI